MMDYICNTEDVQIKVAIATARAMSRNLYNPLALVDWETGMVYYASGRAMEYLCRKYEVRNGRTEEERTRSLFAMVQNAWMGKVWPLISSANEFMNDNKFRLEDCEYLAQEVEGISEAHRRVFYLMKITLIHLGERHNLAIVTLSLSSNKARGRIGLHLGKEKNQLLVMNNVTGQWEPWGIPKLTNSESHLIRLISNGYKQDDLAEMLYCSLNTIKSHKKNILNKLNASNFAEAIMNAINGKII